GCLGVMLRRAETTVVPAHQDLNLFAARTGGAEDVKVGVAGETIKGRFELLTVPDGATGAQIQWYCSGYRKATANGRIDCRINGGRPAAAGKSDHMESFIAGKLAGRRAFRLFEII